MRVLYFSNKPLGLDNKNNYNGGGWIYSQIYEMSKQHDIDVAVGFWSDANVKGFDNEITYYKIKHLDFSRNFYFKCMRRMVDLLCDRRPGLRGQWDRIVQQLICVVNDYKPDIIHIFGTEQEFGLIGSKVNVPVVIHIQGILNPYLNAYLPPFFSWQSIKNIFYPKSFYKSLITKKIWEYITLREKEIFRRNIYYIGRTIWDYRITICMNEDSHYYYGSEILRDEFYSIGSRNYPDSLVIVTTISDPLYKGFDLILKTAKLLKETLDLHFKWIVFGNIEPNIIESKIGIKHIDVNVELGGIVSSTRLIENLINATCYVHPSYIDNSPNSVCEAQIAGLPVVATNAGGLSSLIEDGVTGFLVPTNDPYQMAFCIKELFFRRDRNVVMGKSAKAMALIRHDKIEITKKLVNTYIDIINNYYA